MGSFATTGINQVSVHPRSVEWEVRDAISAILEIALKPVGFRRQLQEILDVLVSISWLRAANKGAIFVTNGQRELVMVAQHELSAPLLNKCAKVPFGCCLCGRAAESKRVLFRNCVDHDHDIRFDGMEDHGHYNLPLTDPNGDVIGVVVLYLEHGHTPHSQELQFMEMLGHALSNVILSRDLKLKAEVNAIRLQQAQMDMLHKLVAASEFRDNETGAHIKRMTQYALCIGRRVGLGKEDLKLLELAAPMHDIGKVGIPDEILLKPGKLTAEEWAIMQRHAEIGANILSGTHELLRASRDIAWCHHEKWDGSGYPRGLKGEEIPLFARICALADVFDALTSERPYKSAWPVEDAIAFIQENSGSHFDPALVEAFTGGLREMLEIRLIYNDHDPEPTARKVVLREALPREGVVSWRASMSVGVDFIDKQHQYLIDLINRIHEGIEQGDTVAIVQALLDMKTYTEVHFTDEEDLMRRNGYPDLERHMALHQGFIEKTESFLVDFERYPLAIGSEFFHYLVNWLVHHIQKVDAEYGRYLAGKGDAVR